MVTKEFTEEFFVERFRKKPNLDHAYFKEWQGRIEDAIFEGQLMGKKHKILRLRGVADKDSQRVLKKLEKKFGVRVF